MAFVLYRITAVYSLLKLFPVLAYNESIVSSMLGVNCTGIRTCDETGWPCLKCSCDMYCGQKGNCCQSVAENQTAALPGYISGDSAFSCTPVYRSIDFFQQYRGVYMVTTCASGENDERCTGSDGTSLLDLLPHTSARTGIHYKNIYCGVCNGATDLLPWKPYVTCSAINVVKADIFLFPNTISKTYQTAISSKDSSCGVEFLPTDNVTVSHDFCSQEQFNRTCDSNDELLSEACDQLTIPYFHTVDNKTTVYANRFCFLCQTNSSFSDNEFQGTLGFSHVDNIFIAELNHGGVQKHDTDELFLEVDSLVKRFTINPASCDEGYLYDPYTLECRPWYCPSGATLVDGVCTPLFLGLEKATFELRLHVVTENASLQFYRSLDKYNLTLDLLSAMFGNDDRVETEVVLIAERIHDFGLYINALLKVVSHISDTFTSEFGLDTFENSYTVPAGEDMIKLNVSLANAVKTEIAVFSQIDIIAIDIKSYAAMEILYLSKETDVKSLYKYPLIDKLAFCIQIALERHEFLDFSDIIDIRVSNTRLFTGEYTRTQDKELLRICFTDYMRQAAERLPRRVEPEEHSPQAILSVICNLCSITGLTATVLTYFMFGELRSIPGKNNMMLAIHLLIAQCLYQFGIQQTDQPKLCIALGIFIHLFWLTSILWMNACTLHMFRTFVTGQSYRSSRALDPQVCCYAFYCYSVAFIIIATNVGVSMYRSDGNEIGYGGNVCYISTPVMVGWTFALPVGVIIILNTGFFFAVVYQISASTMSRRGKSNDRANTVIYMKLSTLTGVTWVFGYLYLWTDFVPLEYIFIVLNAGQGVLIFVSFICTSRIIRLYQDLFRKIGRSVRHCNCYVRDRKIPDRSSKAIEMHVAKHADSKSHSSSKTLETAVGTTPSGKGNGIPVALPGGSVIIRPARNGVVVIGEILANVQSENS